VTFYTSIAVKRKWTLWYHRAAMEKVQAAREYIGIYLEKHIQEPALFYADA
jgi:hypothetical protein